jgi:hypothetical protein
MPRLLILIAKGRAVFFLAVPELISGGIQLKERVLLLRLQGADFKLNALL